MRTVSKDIMMICKGWYINREGINPGKVLIYRQGSVPPSIQYPDADILPTISKECERVWSDMSDIADSFVNYYTNR